MSNSISRRVAAALLGSAGAGVVCAALGLGGPARSLAAEGNPYLAAAGPGNVFSVGADVRTSAAVEGDLVAFGARVLVDQPVKGDALLAGASVMVRAPVAEDVRVAGGDVTIDGKIGGELYGAGGNVQLGKGAEVQGGAALAGALVTIDGRIVGKLKVSAQRVVLNGEVTGDTRLVAEQIELGPLARVGGALSHASRDFKRAEGAVVAGALSRDEDAEGRRDRTTNHQWERRWRYSGPSWLGTVMGYLGLLAAGVVFVLVFPRFSAEAPDEIRSSPWQSLAIGFGVLVGVPVLAVLLFVTLLGIPLGIAAFALYPLLLLVGYLAGALFLAQRARLGLARSAEPDTSPPLKATIGYVALALLVLMLIGRLPVVGPLTVFIVTIAGMGACVLEWQRRRRPPPTASA